MAEKPPKAEKGEKAKERAEKPQKEGKLPAPRRTVGSIIRLVENNLDGGRPVKVVIRSIPGVGFMFSNAVSIVTGLGDRKLESLSPEELKQLADAIQKPQLPPWMLNRRRDPRDGKTKHLVASALDFARKTDINEMKKLKTYKGVRHSHNLPVRGQRTRSSFRKGATVGVMRKKAAPAKAGKEKKE